MAAAGRRPDTVKLRRQDEFRDDVFELIKRTATNSSSMRRDIQAKRQTEAEYILRPLLQMAEGRKRYLPITNYLYNLILSKGSEPHTKLS